MSSKAKANASPDARTVTAKQATKLLKICFKAKRPLFMWGPPGIGKSDIVAGITNDMGGYMVDMRMALMAPDEIRGIPFYNKEKGVMEWAPPEDLPLPGSIYQVEVTGKDGKVTMEDRVAEEWPLIVLFLDEMNSAPPAVQAAGYQLVLNRRIGKFQLPNNVVIVAAGNRESDRGVTYRMPSPLANRFSHVELTVDFDSWFEWAIMNNVHPDVTGFLSASKQDLFDFKPTQSGRAFATPRSWVFVSELMEHEGGEDISDLIAGTIGDGMAIKFLAHRTFAANLPRAEDILSGKVKDLQNKEVSAMYSLVISLCYELREQHGKIGVTDAWHDMANNCFEFWMNNFGTEVCVMGAKVALTNYDLPLVPGKLKCFDKFHKEYGKYIMAAVGQ